LWNTKSLVFCVHISDLKVQTDDSNRRTWSPYWSIFGDQIIYIFWIFCYFLDEYKIISFGWCKNHWINKLCTHLKNSKFFFKKNINFGLQRYFIINIIFNGLNRLLGLLNSKYGREAEEILWFAKHHSLTLYLYTYIYTHTHIYIEVCEYAF
jgi:hypothetical protein